MQTFRITIDPNILNKANQFFNSSLTDILHELLQNARRAWASSVRIESRQKDNADFLTIIDDGKGIFKNSIEIALGGSRWDSQIQDEEDPAGCGLFSLANRGCTIDSCGKKATVTPEAFGGSVPVEIHTTSFKEGTKIDLALNKAEVETLRETIAYLAKYYPLPVFYQGSRVPQSDFLEGALFVKEWSGLRIGVVEETYCWHDGTINFHGLTVDQNFPHILIEKEREIYRVRYLTTRIEVINCPDLKLVLPARKEVIQDEFLAQLQTECERTIYEYLSTLKRHCLPYFSWEKAKSLGVPLPEAEAKLYSWVPECLDSYRTDGRELVEVNDQCLLLDVTDETYDISDYYVFSHAWEKSEKGVLLEPDSDYEGYSWYQALNKIVDFSVVARLGGEETYLEKCMGQDQFKRPDEIKIIYHTGDSENSQTLNEISTDVAFIADAEDGIWYGIEYVTLLVTKESETTIEKLHRLLMDTYFTTSDCTDEFGYETQRELFTSEINQLINLVLHDEDYAERQKIAELTQKFVAWETPPGKTTQIIIKPGGNVSVDFIQ